MIIKYLFKCISIKIWAIDSWKAAVTRMCAVFILKMIIGHQYQLDEGYKENINGKI